MPSWKAAREIRLAIFAGPSSSGKTTTTRKIALRLAEKGLTFLELNLDNYYFDLELHPKDEFGDYDFETPQALDIAADQPPYQGAAGWERDPACRSMISRPASAAPKPRPPACRKTRAS